MVSLLWHWYGTKSDANVDHTIGSDVCTRISYWCRLGCWCFAIFPGRFHAQLKDIILLFLNLSSSQLRSIWRNQTGIEDWIIEKANYRRKDTEDKFVHPYDLGIWNNLKGVLTWTCIPDSDGIEWALLEGCGKYALTVTCCIEIYHYSISTYNNALLYMT